MADHSQSQSQSQSPSQFLGTSWTGTSRPPRPGQLLFAAWIAALIAVAAYSLWQLAPTAELISLFGAGRLTAAQLRKAEIALAQQGLDQYRVEDQQLLVPAQRRSEYLAALAAHDGLPRDLQAVARYSADSSWYWPESERRAQRDLVRQQQLATWIEAMPGVASANVIFDERIEEGFPPRRSQTASVGVICQDNWELTPSQVETIREVVTGGRAGLSPTDVTVADLRAGRTVRAGDQWQTDATSPLEQLRYVQRLEANWQQKVQQLLDHIDGVKVATATSVPPPAENGVIAGPDRVALTISVPKSYLDRLYLQQAAGRTLDARQARELWKEIEDQNQRQIRDVVNNLFTAGTTLAGLEIRTYQRESDLPLWDSALAWRQLNSPVFWRRYGPATGSMLLLALTLLGHLAWKRAPRRDPLTRSLDPPLGDDRLDQRSLERTPDGVEVDGQADEECREELVRLVRHDPNRAAQVLKNWIREAG